MNLREMLMNVRERMNRALLGRANMELDKAHRRESDARLSKIDERLKALDERTRPEEPVANGKP